MPDLLGKKTPTVEYFQLGSKYYSDLSTEYSVPPMPMLAFYIVRGVA